MILRTLRKSLGLLALPLLAACSGQQTERTVVYENTVHHWRIEHVVQHNFPAGTHQYYQVFLNDRPLVLPAKTFNDQRNIEVFLAAGGFDIGHWRNQSIIVTFENIQTRDKGDVRLIRSIMITPDRNEHQVILTDLQTQQQVMVERVEAAAT
ncbi:hypothetical protein IAE35_12720 [Pseudomonas sp. S75]|uniref:hypothetical protein n=1 Tax=unclassified Pseudomonas TaxID=196821 RepID=UPI001908C414|nr:MULTISPECIES: hypothetical protein [unclassified Pseudomonas]MBJ9977202.1 hypothetical protein [Pseudomonas sp. S30]MBK0154204.1 hypothetical protein [Pseudomonas sp. S75]